MKPTTQSPATGASNCGIVAGEQQADYLRKS